MFGRFGAARGAADADDADAGADAGPRQPPPPPPPLLFQQQLNEDDIFHETTAAPPPPFYHHGHASSATSGELLVDARGSGAISSPDSGGRAPPNANAAASSPSSGPPSSPERLSIEPGGATTATGHAGHPATAQQAHHRTRAPAAVSFSGLPPQFPLSPSTSLPPPPLPLPAGGLPFHLHPPPSLLTGLLRSSAAPAADGPGLSSAASMSKLRRHHHQRGGAAGAATGAAAGGGGGFPTHHHHYQKGGAGGAAAAAFFVRWRRKWARAPLGLRALAALAAGALLMGLALLLSPPEQRTTTAASGRSSSGPPLDASSHHHHHRAATRLLESAGLAAAHAAHAAARAAAARLGGAGSGGAGSSARAVALARAAALAGGGNTLADPSFYASQPVLVSYAYFEKDAQQRANLEFFLAAGTGDLPPAPGARAGSTKGPEIHFAIAVAGGACAPCAALDALLPPAEPPSEELEALGIASARSGGAGLDVGRRRRDSPSSSSSSSDASGSSRFTLLMRARNQGLDLGSHNATLSFLALRGRLHRYRFFFLINSSAMGPFVPSWTPPGWHWTHAFTARLGTADAERAALAEAATMSGGGGGGGAEAAAAAGATATAATPPPPADTRPSPPRTVSPGGGRPLRAVRAVGSSLVCLPESDAGGPGARLESWALALDELGLAAAVRGGALAVRACKTCPDAETSVVVGGEYGLTRALLEEGHNVATLMARYAKGVDWSDPSHGRCNDNVHPSRAGTYGGGFGSGSGGTGGGGGAAAARGGGGFAGAIGGLSEHPFETVFVKSTWRVASAYTRRYAAWRLEHLLGRAGTEGAFDAPLYAWGVSEVGTTGEGAAGVAAGLESAYGGAAARARAAYAEGGVAGAGGEKEEEELEDQAGAAAAAAAGAEAARRAAVKQQTRRAIGIPEGEGDMV